MENIEQVILDTLEKAGKPLKSGEVAEMAGLDKKEVSKVISKMKKKGVIVSPKRCYYSKG